MIRFRPMPGLTVAVLVCLPVLIGLGVWQYQRWQWKQGVLAEIEAAVTAPPITGLGALETLTGPVAFRRIQIQGEAIGPTWHHYAPSGAISWRPFRIVRDGEAEALVGFPSFDDAVKDTVAPPTLSGPRAGYVRRVRPRTGMAAVMGADHNPEANRWFAVNPDGAWAPEETLWVDLHPAQTDAEALPVRRPDIPNNHVSYMLTWWSFAVILLVIYAILHIRAGRLGRA